MKLLRSFEVRLSLIGLIMCCSGLAAQAKYGGGTGTSENPYLINTAEHLYEIGANPSDWDKNFKLIADIDLSSYTGGAFSIIGTAALNSFNGLFDGDDHTIANFSLTSTDSQYTGLFGYVTGQIQDLGLVNPNVTADASNVGSLIGHLNAGIVMDCYAKNAHVSGSSKVGGLVGSNAGSISNCYSSGSVSGDAYIGGLVGEVGSGRLTACYSTASTSGNRDVGGLVGKTAKDESVIQNCYAKGAVSGDHYVGGLVGEVERGRVYKCYSTGSVSANQNAGGLVGFMRVLGEVIHSFWDTQTSGQPTSAGGTGKTTAEMQTESTFTSVGWDFYNFWDVCEGTNYPVLIWQIPVGDFRCPDGVNMIDLAWFAIHWRERNCTSANYYCMGIDLDRSRTVDFRDLVIFAENWLEGIAP